MTNFNVPQQVSPRLRDRKEACQILGIGLSTFDALAKTDRLRVLRIGRSVKVSDVELARFIDELQRQSAA